MKKAALMVWICLIVLLAGTVGCSKSERMITNLEDANNVRVGVMTGTLGNKLPKYRVEVQQPKK